MKKLFCLSVLVFASTVILKSQVVRCNWIMVDSVDGLTSNAKFVNDEWIQNDGNPLQYLITKCDCRCKKELVMTGIFQYVGPPDFGVFHQIIDMPVSQTPLEVYFGQAYVSNTTSDWKSAFVNVNQSGQIFLTMQNQPLLPGAIIRVTIVFYIP